MSYSPEYFIARESWRDWRIEAHELIRLARIERGARVLEIGCGGGGLLRMLLARGAEVVGADTLDAALRLAHRDESAAQPYLIQIGYDNHLPFCANSFDAILGQHVIEHIAEVDTALREWHRLLKPNGRLALATPNAHYPDPAHFSDSDHTHIFSPIELREATMRAGFLVKECFTAFPFLTHNRILRGLAVVGYNIFRRVPYFAERGRTILIAASKQEYK